MFKNEWRSKYEKLAEMVSAIAPNHIREYLHGDGSETRWHVSAYGMVWYDADTTRKDFWKAIEALMAIYEKDEERYVKRREGLKSDIEKENQRLKIKIAQLELQILEQAAK